MAPLHSWYSLYRPQKDERLSRPWSHPVVLNMGPLDWESRAYGEKWHYLVKSLSALFRGIRSNYKEDFYCLNCFQSNTTENKLKKHKKVCGNHDYCYVEMPQEGNRILKYNPGEKSMNVPFIIYAALESLI